MSVACDVVTPDAVRPVGGPGTPTGVVPPMSQAENPAGIEMLNGPAVFSVAEPASRLL